MKYLLFLSLSVVVLVSCSTKEKVGPLENKPANNQNTPNNENVSLNTALSTNITPMPSMAVNVTGTWLIDEAVKVRFTQKGDIIVINQLIDDMESDDGKTEWIRIEDGKIKNNKISFCINVGESWCLKGTVSQNTMKLETDFENPTSGADEKTDGRNVTAKRTSKVGTQPNARDTREN